MTARTAVIALLVLVALATAIWFVVSSKPAEMAPVVVDAPKSAEPRDAEPRAPDAPGATEAIRGRPFDEDAQAARAEKPQTGGLLVTVVNAEGAPVAGATVTAHTPREDFLILGPHSDAGRTRADGTARIAPGRDTHVIATAAGYPPVIAPIEDPTRLRVTLPGDVTLRARVRVNGAVPKEPMRFILRGYDDPTAAWPETARGVANHQGFGELRMALDTDAQGELAARGVRRGTSVTLQIPEGFVLAGPERDAGSREIPAVANGDAIPIDLVAMSALTGTVTGRIVDPNTGNRSASATHAGLEVRYALGSRRSQVTGRASVVKGRFRIFFAESPLSSASIEVWDQAPARKLAEKQVEGPIDVSKDIGEIALPPPPQTVLFHMMNESGAPLAGARVLVRGLSSSKSDAEGRASLMIPAGTRSVVAGAPGFKIASVPMPDKLPESMDIRLERGASLVIRVRHEDPAVPIKGLRVLLEYDVDETTGAGDSNGDFQDVRTAKAGVGWRMSAGSGGSPVGEPRMSGRQTSGYEVEPGKDIVVTGFKKGDEIQVSVRDQYLNSLMDQSIKITEDEPHPIELVVRSMPRRLRGTIRDHQDRPLRGAEVEMGNAFMHSFTGRTDADGNVEFAEVYADQAPISVSAPGHVSKTVTVDVVEKPFEIRLERARDLVLELTGPVIPKQHVHVAFKADDGTMYGAGPRGERFYSFNGIPCRAGTIEVTAGDKTATVAIGAEETRATVARPQ